MNRFEQCLMFVLGNEGGYSNNPADRGGATNCGITQAVYDEWRIGRGFGRQPVSGISMDEVMQIYLSRYWLMGKCDRLPAPLDYIHFDGAVNHGVAQAGKFLQRALGVLDDGIVGPVTISAVQEENGAGGIDRICDDILHQRSDFYDHLADRDPKQKIFLKGWHNRIAEVRQRVLA